MLQSRIDCDLETLDKLNVIYPWIPNSQSIRPNIQSIEKKKHLIQQIELNWESPKDYINHTIFGFKYYINKDYKKFTCPEYLNQEYLKLNRKWYFQPSMFPYNLDYKETNHWVLWNSEKEFDYDYSDEVINEIIKRNLFYQTEIGTTFEFVWYKNPKPTVKEFYHVQVFWISRPIKHNDKKLDLKLYPTHKTSNFKSTSKILEK